MPYYMNFVRRKKRRIKLVMDRRNIRNGDCVCIVWAEWSRFVKEIRKLRPTCWAAFCVCTMRKGNQTRTKFHSQFRPCVSDFVPFHMISLSRPCSGAVCVFALCSGIWMKLIFVQKFRPRTERAFQFPIRPSNRLESMANENLSKFIHSFVRSVGAVSLFFCGCSCSEANISVSINLFSLYVFSFRFAFCLCRVAGSESIVRCEQPWRRPDAALRYGGLKSSRYKVCRRGGGHIQQFDVLCGHRVRCTCWWRTHAGWRCNRCGWGAFVELKSAAHRHLQCIVGTGRRRQNGRWTRRIGHARIHRRCDERSERQRQHFYMGVGQWGQRPWQLQLRRLHEFNLDAIDIECNGTRIGAMVFGKVQFHIGHHIQQRQQRRTTSCHNRFTSFVHHIAHGYIGIGTAGRRHCRISTRSQFEFDMAGLAAYRWVCQFKYSTRQLSSKK